MHHRRTFLTFLCALAAGCSGKPTPPKPRGSGSDSEGPQGGGSEENGEEAGPVSQLKGKVEIDGSSTVGPISNRAYDEFHVSYPHVDISVGITGTGNGFKRFVNGEIDIADASRPIKPEEFEACQKAGIEFVELPIAYDGLTIVKHPSNEFLKELTLDDIKKIFLKTGEAKTWKDVNADWPEEEIKIFAPGTGSGTYDYFFIDVLKDEKNARGDMSVSENDNELVRGVANNPFAIGFFGAAYYLGNKDKVTAIPVVNPKTKKAVSPTLEAVESGEYSPFSRPLFIYVKASSMKRAEVKKFVEYYVKNSGKLASEAMYFPLPEEIGKLSLKYAREVKPGSHFIDANGKAREGAFADLIKTQL